MDAEIFGTLKDGREAKLYTLANKNGMVAKVSEYGAVLTSLIVPDKDGKLQDVTLGYDDLDGWENDEFYFGATVGRVGNRIAGGKFSLDGQDYSLATNNAPGGIPCHLHGGLTGFNKVLWKGEPVPGGVKLHYLSRDGEEGYPGDLSVTITYLLNDENELLWQVEATTSAPTPVNIVHHSYWNLSGNTTTSIKDHLLTLNADHYLTTCEGLIPTGELKSVEGTPMDFHTATEIGQNLHEDYQDLKFGNGYDHAWVLKGTGLRLAAQASDPKSGRTLELHTDQPAVHLYSSNFLDGVTPGKQGLPYAQHSAFCLETELFPDGPNKPKFPNCILRPGEVYRHKMVHKFSW